MNNIIKKIAKDEDVSVEYISKELSCGSIVIPKNKSRNNSNFKFIGIGKGLKTKVNANIGTSPERISIKKELQKLEVAIQSGTDSIMDLSTGGNLRKIRQEILKNSNVIVGTVPIYQVACETTKKGLSIGQMDSQHMFDVIEEHANDGVDFITVHCGVTKKNIGLLKTRNRLCGIVSRGGTFLAEWILTQNKENPLYKKFDRLLDIASKYNLTLSLGDGLRPGSILDANDKPQIGELTVLGELVLEARKKNVSVIIEGPGHMPINQIISHIKQQKKLTYNAPFYLLGPLVTDIGAGYDHITSAIGAGIASAYGADFICYVTPAEHLRLPDVQDVREGVISSRIAGHAGDIVKGVKGASKLDREMSIARKNLDWNKQKKFSIDPLKFEFERKKSLPKETEVCTMCGHFCAMRQATKFKI